MFSLKLLTISSSLCFLALFLKLSLPHLSSFPISDLLNVVASWLKPPYLYLLINCIIITIVATSKLQSKFDHHAFTPLPPHHPLVNKSEDDVAFDHFSFSPPPLISGVEDTKSRVDLVNTTSPLFDNGHNGPEKVSDFSENVNARGFESEEKEVAKNHKEHDLEDSYVKVMNFKSNKVISRAPAAESVMEFSKPPASSRFGHRRAVKTTAPDQGGKTLKVSKPKRQETLESTWKTITDGRPMPLTRHLRKSDTWEHHPAHTTNKTMDLPDYSKMTKSETFNDRTIRKKNSPMLSRSSGSGKLRKDPSLSQDELNKRVEAFITKFNEDMRLQRQESLNQYMEMINRGAGP